MLLPEFTFLFVVSLVPLWHETLADQQSEALCTDKVCYSVHLGENNFLDAKQKCVHNGGDLVTIKSREEAEHLVNLVLQLSTTFLDRSALKLWIGLQLKNKCYVPHKLLKGFSWVTGDEETEESQFSNWMNEPKSTCTQSRCVAMNFDLTSSPSLPGNYKWTDGKCTVATDGYLCKFHFKGMCKGLVLGGLGSVEYNTPFGLMTSSLTLVPHGSMAVVICEQNIQNGLLVCKEEENVFTWGSSTGPLCATPKLGCTYNNGGCEQECIKTQTGSISCSCKEGYVLASDLVSCLLVQSCQSNPCQHTCTNYLQGFECTCFEGFILAEDKLNCVDVDECLQKPCEHLCSNNVGSFQCSCNEGFIRQGKDCVDQDECIDSPCPQGCLNSQGSYYCSCNEGYEKGSDGSCLDVDECINSPCAEKCQNTPGSYVCYCPEGFVLSPDGISCNPDIQNQDTPTNDQELKPKDREIIGIIHRDNTHHPTISPSSPDSMTEVLGTGNPVGGRVHIMLTTPMAAEDDSTSSNESVDQVQSGHSDGKNTVLLVSTVCSCGVLLLLAVVAGIMCYRRRNSNKVEEDYKPPTATDNYCWVPDQSGNSSANNDYR
ncbi:complement component C1q receptor [Pelodytes ibericus]